MRVGKNTNVGTRQWGTHEKLDSRQRNLGIYRECFGSPILPVPDQYWTMCGRLGVGGVLQAGSEYHHIVQTSRFCTSEQFIGVDIDPDTHQDNLTLGLPTTLISGDIVLALEERLVAGQFRPGVINLDTHHKTRLALDLLVGVMDLVNQTVGVNCLVLLNLVLQHKVWTAGNVDKDQFLDRLLARLNLSFVYQKGWQFADGYTYEGTSGSSNRGSSCSTMMTIAFCRKTSFK